MASISSSASSTTTTTLTLTSWWLKDPLGTLPNLAVSVVKWDPHYVVRTGSFYPKDRDHAVVASGDLYGEEGPITFRALTKAAHDSLIDMLRSRRTLLLENVIGEAWYCRITGDIARNLVKAAPTVGELSPIRFAYEVSTQLTEVASP